MPPDDTMLHVRPRAVQTAADGTVVGSRACEVCGTALTGRESQQTCSDRCRARRWRMRQARRGHHRDNELRVLALAARQAIEALERRLEDPT